MNDTEYNEYIEHRAKRTPCLLNCLKAFLTGGIICALGEAAAYLFASLCLIFLAGLLTGIGVFDKIAKFGGGGALVPITGFSNAMAAPAIDSKTEGFVTGVAAKMFTIAGPVIVYGVAASAIYGVFYYLFG